MGWVRCNSGGVSAILTNGQVSTTSAYATANFNDISDYTYLFTRLKFNYDDVDYESVWGFYADKIPTGFFYEFTYLTDSGCPLPSFTVRITHTSIALTHYNGAYRNVYCDIKGIKDNIW